jgi:hypothetical protein
MSDAMLRELLLLLEQGISPGRLRPEAINITRALLGSPPDAEGVFGNIPVNLRRPRGTNEPSYAREVFNKSEKWLEQTSMPSHPVGLSLGCFPAGIESGCRKHLECPTEVERNCPFRDESTSASVELRARLKDPEKDVLPVLRRCQFLGCVRPERAREWIEEQQKQHGLPVKDRGEVKAPQNVGELTQLLGFRGEDGKEQLGCSGSGAASHNCLDSLCPHFRRSWKEPIPERPNESEAKDGLNQHRFLQCSLSRPWPVYGFDPAKPAIMRRLDDSGLPIEFGNMLRGMDRLPRPHGFTELPVLWLRRAGFSGVGIVVVDEKEKKEGVYYLQMGSTELLVRDYYEMPYFWLGEQPGTQWPDVVRNQLSEGRPQYIQCIFRGHRQAAAAPADWKPELLEIFRDSSANRLAPFGRGRFLYCPDGEISFFLLCMRLLRLLRAIAGGGKSKFEKNLLAEFQAIANKEIWMEGGDEKTQQHLYCTFNKLLNIRGDGEPSELREELVNLGLLMPGEERSGDPLVVSRESANGATPRLRSLASWLLHFHQVCEDGSRSEHFIPTDFLSTKAPEGLEGWFSLRDVVSRIGSGGGHRNFRATLPECVSKVLGQLDDVLPAELDRPVDPSAARFSLRGIVAAIMSVVAENLGDGTDPLPYLENMILQIVRRGRFPLAGYYAWRSSGNRDFCLGHFAVPIGQGNPVTSREEEGTVPWREDQFFLAGIDECLLAGVECDHLFQPLFGGGRRLAHGLENVALLGRAIFSPLADSTINYTIFQKRLSARRNMEIVAATSRAHQQTTLIRPFLQKILTQASIENLSQRDSQRALAGLQETVIAIYNENKVYLDVSTGHIGDKETEDGRPDFVSFGINTYLCDLAKSYSLWAKTADYSDRRRDIEVDAPDAEVMIPRSYLRTILWELITNHQKYGQADSSIRVTAILCKADDHGGNDILTISVASPLRAAAAESASRHRGGHGIGHQFIDRALRFMMGYQEREEIQPPLCLFDEVGNDYVSLVRIQLARVAKRF